MSMNTAELETFLAQTFPTPLGVIATLRGDGSPHIVPVWFRWDTGAVTIWTTETRAWVRNLLRDPRVAFSVQTFEEPYPAVMMRGDATVATAHDAATVEEIRAITRRYLVRRPLAGPAHHRHDRPGARRVLVGRRLKPYRSWPRPLRRGRCRPHSVMVAEPLSPIG